MVMENIQSNNLQLTNIKVFNRFDMAEDDGIDIIQSQNVTVPRAIAVALDGSFSTKTWTNTTDIAQRWPGQPHILDSILFDHCIAFTICYGFKIGQGVLQTQSNVRFENGIVYDGAIGIGISHQYGAAAIINVTFENIDIERLSQINAEHGTWLAWYVWNNSNLYGRLINITAKNILVRERGQTFEVIRGLDNNATIDIVTLINIWDIGFVNNVTILPIYSPPPVRENVALNRNSTGSSSAKDHSPQLMFNGDLETRWIQIDLGSLQSINGSRIFWEQAYSSVYSVVGNADFQ